MMIRSILLTFLTILLCHDSQSQNKFQLNVGGLANGRIIVSRQTSDGGFMFSGYTNTTPADYFLIKIDSVANIEWANTYGMAGSPETLTEAIQTSDGGYMMAGYTIVSGRSNMYFVKADSNGDTLFTRTFGGLWNESAQTIIQTSDGGYIAGGAFSDNSTPTNVSMMLYKMDAAGDSSWVKVVSAPGATSWESAASVKQTSDGGYIIGGQYVFGQFTSDCYLVKTDNTGNVQWNKTFHFPGTTTTASVEQLPDDGFIIGGKYVPVGGLNDKLFLIRTNSTGDTLWTRSHGGQYLDDGGYATQTSDGGYIQSGRTENFGANSIGDACLIKTTANGTLSWSYRFGGNQSELFGSVQQTSDQGYITGGVTGSFGTGYLYIVKTDSMGLSNCAQFATPAQTYSPPVTIGTTTLSNITPGSWTSSSVTVVGMLSNTQNTICYTTTSQIENELNEIVVGVFPNPAISKISVLLQVDNRKAIKYELLNSLGETIFQNISDNLNTIDIDIESYPAGIYFLKLSTDYSTKTFKIAKM